MRNSILFFLLITGVFTNCQNDPKFTAETTVTGYLDNVAGSNIILARQTPEGVFPMDTTNVQEDGYFSFEPVVADMQLYRIVISPSQFITFAMQKGDHIHMEANGNDVAGYYIEGSQESELINQFAKGLISYNLQMDSVRKEITVLTAAKNGKSLYDAFEVQKQMFEERHQANLAFIEKHPGSLAAYFIATSLPPEEDAEAYVKVYDALKKTYPTFEYLPLLAEQVNQLKLTPVGSLAPELSFPNPQGDTIALSSLRGKFVLVDFWASWCKPCREQNPAVKSIYDKFAAKGFEIYSYSLDDDRAKWTAAIAADGLVWPQTSDLLGWNAQGSLDYGVHAIPATFLLDTNGIIIAKNPTVDELETQLNLLLKD